MKAALVVLFGSLIASTGIAAEPVAPLLRAHAHNDYEHKRPLLDALDRGFCSVEADIFLKDDELLVAHTPLFLDRKRTLQSLYLDPLRERAKANGGRIFKNGPTFYLLIDVKTEAKTTYAALAKILETYAELLSVVRDEQFESKAVTVVISGNCDREAIAKQKVRYTAIDGRPKDLAGKESAVLIPWVSASWSSEFQWKGSGTMPEAEQRKLREYVDKAHQQKRLVRFWGTPDQPEVWKQQYELGVDFINTDKLAELHEFLVKQPKPTKK